MPNYTYDPNTDYQALINQAINQGNYYMAAIYEQQRNAKISGENMQGVSATNQYSNYLPTTEQKSGYVNPYQQQLEATIGKVTGNFAYNPDKDPIASAYKKTYLREADRTMQDTLGQYSTMTGGIPSTQAVAAASQTADNYKAQLSAQLAQLGEQAYNREVNKVGLLMSAAQNADSQYYNSISAAMSRWAQLGAADAQVAQVLGVPVGTQTSDAQYQQWQKAMAEKEYADNLAYQQWQQGMTQNEYEWQKAQSERDYALSLLSMGVMPTAQQLTAAGISAQEAEQIVAAAKSKSGSGGSYSSSESKGKPVTDQETIDAAIAAYQSGDHVLFAQIIERLRYQQYDADGLALYICENFSYVPETGYTGASQAQSNQFTNPYTAP